jgi:hypothetical protein
VEALRALGKLYSLAYPEMWVFFHSIRAAVDEAPSENKDPAAIVQFAWIPTEMFQMIKVTTDLRCVCLFPLCVDISG